MHTSHERRRLNLGWLFSSPERFQTIIAIASAIGAAALSLCASLQWWWPHSAYLGVVAGVVVLIAAFLLIVVPVRRRTPIEGIDGHKLARSAPILSVRSWLFYILIICAISTSIAGYRSIPLSPTAGHFIIYVTNLDSHSTGESAGYTPLLVSQLRQRAKEGDLIKVGVLMRAFADDESDPEVTGLAEMLHADMMVCGSVYFFEDEKPILRLRLVTRARSVRLLASTDEFMDLAASRLRSDSVLGLTASTTDEIISLSHIVMGCRAQTASESKECHRHFEQAVTTLASQSGPVLNRAMALQLNGEEFGRQRRLVDAVPFLRDAVGEYDRLNSPVNDVRLNRCSALLQRIAFEYALKKYSSEEAERALSELVKTVTRCEPSARRSRIQSIACEYRGHILRFAGDTHGAITQYSEAITAEPTNVVAHFQITTLIDDKTTWDVAIAAFERQVETMASPTALELGILGSAWWDGAVRFPSDYERCARRAAELSQHAAGADNCAIDPRRTLIQIELAALEKLPSHLKKPRITEALRWINEALQIDPNDVGILNDKGLVLKEAGDHAGALTCFGRVIALDPGRADAYSNIGNIYVELQHCKEALQAHEVALFTARAAWTDHSLEIWPYQFNYASALYHCDQRVRAHAEFANIQNNVMSRPDVIIDWVEDLIDGGEIGEACALLQRFRDGPGLKQSGPAVRTIERLLQLHCNAASTSPASTP